MFKKSLGFVLSLSLFFSLLCYSPIFAQETDNEYASNTFYTEEEVIDTWGEFSDSEKSDYAGMYIDDNNNLTLLYVENSSSLIKALERGKKNQGALVSKDGTQKQSLIIKSAKHNYNSLLAVMKALEKGFENGEIKNLSLDVKNNCVDVGISKGAEEAAVEEYLHNILKATFGEQSIDKDILSFHVDEEEVTLFANVYGTTQINNGTWSASPAVGFYNSSGQRGFITCAHHFAQGNTMYAGSTKIGVMGKNRYNGTCDAAFVVFDSEDRFIPTLAQNEELSNDVPIVGSNMVQRGSTTGLTTGQITSNNYTYTGNGFTWVNLIRSKGIMTNGDSGGAAQSGTTDAGRTAKIVGICHGGGATYSLYIKGAVIRQALY